MIGLWISNRLLRRSSLVEADRMTACMQDGTVCRQSTIRESNDVMVPVTVGWWRPSVLLPMEWREWSGEKLSAVIAHEYSHIERRDFLVTLAAEFNRCLYWFHPVSWWLRSRLSDLAEEACDDAAIVCTGDPTGYARHLLEVATSLTAGCRRVEFGLSMARESNVESRIATILDRKRPLSRQLTWRSVTVITAIAIPLIASAASVRPVSSESASDEHKNPKSTAAANEIALAAETEKTSPKADNETVRIRGQVTNIDGKPISNAKVQIFRSKRSEWYAMGFIATLLSEFHVDDQGRFDHSIAKTKLPLPEKYQDKAVMVVSAPNYALTTISGDSHFKVVDGVRVSLGDFLKKETFVALRPAEPIRGRLLSIEGRPVAGAQISVFKISRPDAKRLDAWIKQTAKKPLSESGTRALMFYGGPVSRESIFPTLMDFQLPTDLIAPVVSDENGKFEFTALAAKDDAVVLRIKGKGITDSTVHVLARDMKPIYGRHLTNFSVSGAYHGQNFDFITQPSVPVFGVVRDIDR